jgi:hypothetical protein
MEATQKEIDSALSLLAGVTPALPDVHPRQWIRGTDYPVLSFQESFQAFVNQRERLLTTLRKLSFGEWSRAGMIGGRKHTVLSQARRMARHENEHCDQIAELLKPKNAPNVWNWFMRWNMLFDYGRG